MIPRRGAARGPDPTPARPAKGERLIRDTLVGPFLEEAYESRGRAWAWRGTPEPGKERRMTALQTRAKAASIVYPESDGEPMADNSKQFRWIVFLADNLQALYRD